MFQRCHVCSGWQHGLHTFLSFHKILWHREEGVEYGCACHSVKAEDDFRESVLSFHCELQRLNLDCQAYKITTFTLCHLSFLPSSLPLFLSLPPFPPLSFCFASCIKLSLNLRSFFLLQNTGTIGMCHCVRLCGIGDWTKVSCMVGKSFTEAHP